MLSLLCTLPFGVFSVQTFFSAYIFNKLFFLTFVATNYLFQFFSSPPPPQISNGASIMINVNTSTGMVAKTVEIKHTSHVILLYIVWASLGVGGGKRL